MAYTLAVARNYVTVLLRGAGWLLAMLVLASSGFAQTVYVTEEDGVPSFSDAPPAGDAQVQTIELEVQEPAEDPQLEERLAAMRETTDRMADDRREREKHRADLRDQREESQRLAAATVPTTVVVNNGGYWPAAGRPWYRPWNPNRPIRPGPPYRPQPYPVPSTTSQVTPPPGWSVMRPGNAQLMRPIVSGQSRASQRGGG